MGLLAQHRAFEWMFTGSCGLGVCVCAFYYKRLHDTLVSVHARIHSLASLLANKHKLLPSHLNISESIPGRRWLVMNLLKV